MEAYNSVFGADKGFRFIHGDYSSVPPADAEYVSASIAADRLGFLVQPEETRIVRWSEYGECRKTTFGLVGGRLSATSSFDPLGSSQFVFSSLVNAIVKHNLIEAEARIDSTLLLAEYFVPAHDQILARNTFLALKGV